MSYNRENFKKVKEAFSEKRARSAAEADAATAMLHSRFPRIAEIDAQLSKTGLALFEIAVRGGDIREQVNELEKLNLALQSERAQILLDNGLPADADTRKYECEKCRDNGFTDTVMCDCFRRELIKASLETSGLGELITTQTFETFDLKYYNDTPKTLENIKFIVSECKRFADGIADTKCKSLLFMGGTGLGKTHLSTSVAVRAINNGFDVVYETAQNMIADFEYERFERYRSYDGDDARKTDKYFDCDLLIIDDLGTEITNQFTVSCLYNIINTRIIGGKKMIINTNLTRDELRRRYADRITSRLFGEFRPLLFMGTDIRAKKLKYPNN